MRFLPQLDPKSLDLSALKVLDQQSRDSFVPVVLDPQDPDSPVVMVLERFPLFEDGMEILSRPIL